MRFLEDVSLKDIIRDFTFLFFISYWSGFLTGYATYFAEGDFDNQVYTFINYCSVFSGFCFIARWNEKNRIKHLSIVAALLFLLTLVEGALTEQLLYSVFALISLVIMVPISWKIAQYKT